MLTSEPTFFSADVLNKCALIALQLIAEEGRDGDGCHAPDLGDEKKTKAKLGRKTKLSLPLSLGKATWATLLAKVASSCHMALDMLCQVVIDAPVLVRFPCCCHGATSPASQYLVKTKTDAEDQNSTSLVRPTCFEMELICHMCPVWAEYLRQDLALF